MANKNIRPNNSFLTEPSIDFCNQRVPIRVVAAFIGISEFFALLVNCVVIGTFSHLPREQNFLYSHNGAATPNASLGLSIAALLIGSIAIAIMLWGMHTERAVLLVPQLICQVGAGVGLLIQVAFLSINTAATPYQAKSTIHTNVVVIALCVCAFVLTGLFFMCSLICYRFIRKRETFRKEQTKTKVVKFHKNLDEGKIISSSIAKNGIEMSNETAQIK